MEQKTTIELEKEIKLLNDFLNCYQEIEKSKLYKNKNLVITINKKINNVYNQYLNRIQQIKTLNK